MNHTYLYFCLRPNVASLSLLCFFYVDFQFAYSVFYSNFKKMLYWHAPLAVMLKYSSSPASNLCKFFPVLKNLLLCVSRANHSSMHKHTPVLF
jgi:hypothetical protein